MINITTKKIIGEKIVWLKKSFILSAFLLFVSAGQAQCPKFAFFEDFTQAGCSPCALGNSFFQPNVLWPNPDKVRLVSYHCYWPGTDPMYTHNPNGNNNRTFFYNVNGIPQMRLCGIRKISDPADFSQRDVDNTWNEGSPLKISLNMVDNGNNRDVSVTVKTIGTPPPGSYTLYVAVIQRDTTYTTAPGQNGETYFPDVFREMLPNDNGASITLPSTGNSVTFGPYNFLEDASFWVNPNKIGVVAFIQNNATLEIIQSGSTFDTAVNETMTQPSPLVMNVPANTGQGFPFTVGNSGNSPEQFNFALTSVAPPGWIGNFLINNINYSAPVTLTLQPGTSVPASISVVPNNNHGVGKFTLTMTSVTNPNAPPMFVNVYVISGVTDLIVNSSNVIIDESILGDANNWSSVYTNGLAATGCTTWGNLDDHEVLKQAFQANQMQGVKNIYYNVGYTAFSLAYSQDSIMATQLTNFLNGGGRMFLSGQEVAYYTDGQFASTAGHAFMNNMMGTHYFRWGYDATLSRTITPISADPVFGTCGGANVTNYYGMNPSGWPNYFPMIVHDTLLGQPIFYYNADTNLVAGVRTTNGIFKTVFLSPGIEMLGSSSIQNQILNISYQWFNGTLSVQEFDAAMKNISLGQNYPNPGLNTTTVPVSGVDRDMKLQVMDVTGRVLMEQEVSKGSMQVNVNVGALKQGIYFYRLSDGISITPSKPMQVTH